MQARASGCLLIQHTQVEIQVMWARWQEAAVLLFHRGLGTQGEMDAALEEEAGFKTWMANNSSHRDSPAVDSPAAGERDAAVDVGSGAGRAVVGGASGTSCSALGDEPQTIGGVPTVQLDQAIQAALSMSLSALHVECIVRALLTFASADMCICGHMHLVTCIWEQL